jgi:hypothetical protein
MKLNMGLIDRIIRLIIAIIIGILYFSGQLHGVVGAVLGVIAAIFLVTSIFSRCPLYTLFGLSTLGPKQKCDSDTKQKE